MRGAFRFFRTDRILSAALGDRAILVREFQIQIAVEQKSAKARDDGDLALKFTSQPDSALIDPHGMPMKVRKTTGTSHSCTQHKYVWFGQPIILGIPTDYVKRSHGS
jgi:predicted DNA-binding transcriptional regulator YafY